MVPRRRADRYHDLDLADILWLRVGWSEREVQSHPGREEELKRLWAAVREDFMPHPDYPEGAAEANVDRGYMPAGTRAFAWWKFDAAREVPADQQRVLEQMHALATWERNYLRKAKAAVR